MLDVDYKMDDDCKAWQSAENPRVEESHFS